MTVETIHYTNIEFNAEECDRLVRILTVAFGMNLHEQDADFASELIDKLKR
jgi:hypothetical protein